MASASLHEPDARYWHTSQCIGEKVYIWGGRTSNYGKKEETEKLRSTVQEYDATNRSWSERITKGTPHPGLAQVAGSSSEKFLYLYGGNDGERLNGILSQLNLKKMMWSQLSPENAKNSPMIKDACGMIHFQGHDGQEKLLLMCGYASPTDPHNRDNGGSSDRKSKFIPDDNSISGVQGWTNEIHVFNIATGNKGNNHLSYHHVSLLFITIDGWMVPNIRETGDRPEPCGDITISKIDQSQALFYGGNMMMCLYLIKLDTEPMVCINIFCGSVLHVTIACTYIYYYVTSLMFDSHYEQVILLLTTAILSPETCRRSNSVAILNLRRIDWANTLLVVWVSIVITLNY